jgi:hypothetical protein
LTMRTSNAVQPRTIHLRICAPQPARICP